MISTILLSIVFHQTTFAEAIFEKKWIKLGAKNVLVEVADSYEQQAQGLMFRTKLGTDEGMIFTYDSERQLSFWMKNTKIPLSIGFFNKNKVLVDVLEMSVPSVLETDLPHYVSRAPAMYAIEMNTGWYAKNKLVVGRDKFEWTKVKPKK